MKSLFPYKSWLLSGSQRESSFISICWRSWRWNSKQNTLVLYQSMQLISMFHSFTNGTVFSGIS